MAIRSRCYPLNLRRCLLRLLRGIRRNFFRLSPCCGQVPYVLLTRAPVAGGSIATPPLPLDLHVLSLSLAFILSQDQTLRCCLYSFSFFSYFYIRASEMSNTDRLFCSLFAFTETACGFLTLYRSKRRILEIDRDRFFHDERFDSCTTSLCCKYFNVLFLLSRSLWRSAENFAKVQPLFESRKFF